MHNGYILIDKPAGISSFGVVARVRRVLSQSEGKKVKVGHTGTLDPFATGLMIIVVGTYCKRADEFSKLDKTYRATVRLGEVSSTGDPEGDITAISTEQPTTEHIHSVLEGFRGTISQTPPAFSAIKVNGVRAYKLARAGKSVDVPARQVTVYQLEVIKYTYPDMVIETTVSSGTYIRTLAADIGEVLGTGAYCQQLRRTKIADWDVSQALSIEELTVNKIEKSLLSH